jgi:hypothetical protein
MAEQTPYAWVASRIAELEALVRELQRTVRMLQFYPETELRMLPAYKRETAKLYQSDIERANLAIAKADKLLKEEKQ